MSNWISDQINIFRNSQRWRPSETKRFKGMTEYTRWFRFSWDISWLPSNILIAKHWCYRKYLTYRPLACLHGLWVLGCHFHRSFQVYRDEQSYLCDLDFRHTCFENRLPAAWISFDFSSYSSLSTLFISSVQILPNLSSRLFFEPFINSWNFPLHSEIHVKRSTYLRL